MHIYLGASAPEQMAVDLVVDSKTDKPSACNSAETLLIQEGAPAAEAVLRGLLEAGVRLHADEAAARLAHLSR